MIIAKQLIFVIKFHSYRLLIEAALNVKKIQNIYIYIYIYIYVYSHLVYIYIYIYIVFKRYNNFEEIETEDSDSHCFHLSEFWRNLRKFYVYRKKKINLTN